MIIVAFTGVAALLAAASLVLAKRQAPARVSLTSGTRLHLSTMERTHAVPEDRC